MNEVQSKPTQLVLTVGPPSGFANVTDIRSVLATKKFMEMAARRTFATKARGIPVVWPTVRAVWDGLALTISGEVTHG